MFLQGISPGLWGELPSQLSQEGLQAKRLLDKLITLVDNILAIKYSPARETVSIVVSEDESEVVLQVRDKGPDISDVDKSMVFENIGRVFPTRRSLVPASPWRFAKI